MPTRDTDSEMDALLRRSLRRWFLANKARHTDSATGDVNLTSLVEDWDRTCAGGRATLDPDHLAWEIAAEVCL